APDADYSAAYRATWSGAFGGSGSMPTGRFNGGLYWTRAVAEPEEIALLAGQVSPVGRSPVEWEQGLIACLYESRPVQALPAQRYFYPVFDGLPGGALGYDYRKNPCGFASIHFGGLARKPNEAECRLLAPEILGGVSR